MSWGLKLNYQGRTQSITVRYNLQATGVTHKHFHTITHILTWLNFCSHTNTHASTPICKHSQAHKYKYNCPHAIHTYLHTQRIIYRQITYEHTHLECIRADLSSPPGSNLEINQGWLFVTLACEELPSGYSWLFEESAPVDTHTDKGRGRETIQIVWQLQRGRVSAHEARMDCVPLMRLLSLAAAHCCNRKPAQSEQVLAAGTHNNRRGANLCPQLSTETISGHSGLVHPLKVNQSLTETQKFDFSPSFSKTCDE